jgi:hypothetical protein
VVATAEGPYFVKLRGAAQGTSALVAEVVVAALADHIGLPVPERRIIALAADTPSQDRNDELADLLRASAGENLGFRFLPEARPFVASDLSRVTRDFAAQVRWLDWLVLNPDRSPANPNLMVEGPRLWLIDHGAALPFQHDWGAVTESTPLRPALRVPHILADVGHDLAQWDAHLTGLIGREELAAALDQVPDSFLRPLISGEADSAGIARRRQAYVAFLWKRLRGPHLFSD